ncbi:LysR family transcriptional regulator [Jeongeupia naejangsanensis]|uniref:LysR family transcriptional regulator n=1 Tax=Jeongeupia naejangsanensis TaxID=613195 RepID=A0ABS2BNY4_9NEIS|nr:LysR family transcriptional regulator [Jeongeupia naejangsanensis]MBM3117268.1 LysR family transcriptional regulator [Jeongeupia naejangsanensis]
MDKLRAMQTFVAIVEHGSLTRAARALASSLPVVVRTLAALEEALGVRLLNRTTRRLSLTDEGRAYLESCRHILGAVDEAEQRLSDQHDEPSGRLVVTASVLYGQMYVAPAVTGFLQAHPKVQCRLVLLDRVANLIEEGIDVGIRIGPLDDSNLIAQRVGEIHRIAAASPDYLARHPAPQLPGDLVHANCIRFTGNGRTTWLFQNQGRSLSVPISGNLECNHGLPAVDACVAGLGIGQFLSYQITEHLAAGRLLPLLQDFQLPPLPVHIVYPHAGLLPHRTRLFIQWMKRALAG